MGNKLYNTYSVGEELTLFEIDKKVIKGKEYLLLLQKQEPNLVVVGFFEEGKLEIVNNRVISAQLLKIFTEDKSSFYAKLKPFIDFASFKSIKA